MQETNKKRVWYYDIETLNTFFSVYFISKDGKIEKDFIIHESRNDIYLLLNFLRTEVRSLIGFNNLQYDYVILHYILTDLLFYKEQFNDAETITTALKNENDRLFAIMGNGGFTSIPSWKIKIPQLDIFKILHLDNPNNRASLKKIEFVIRYDNVDDIDISKIDYVTTEMIPKIMRYNRNDVLATKKLVENSINDINLRISIKKLYSHYGKDVDWMNFNDAKIGSEIFTVPLANSLNIEIKELKKLRTERPRIAVKDIILPYINFKTPEFNDVLKFFKKKHIVTTTKPFELEKIFKNIKYKFGAGGLHGAVKASKHVSDGEYCIVEVDVASYYPNLSIRNGFHPEHLGKIFCEIYESVYDQRVNAKKKAKLGENVYYNKLLVAVYKLSLNGSYGKSNDKHSFLYDPKMTMSICVNGQLLLCMLIERLTIYINSLSMIYANTDGVCFKVKRTDMEKVRKIYHKWEKLTNLELEEDSYKKVIIRDVNNYLKVKEGENLEPSFPEADFYDNKYTVHTGKGCFEVVKTKNGKISYAKNWSHSIVQKAIYEYYINGKDVRHTILDCTDVFDFYMFYKTSISPKTGTPIKGYISHDRNKGKFVELNKSTRYYISTNGGKILKINDANPNKRDNLHKGCRCTIANKHIKKNIEDYNIDYNYYIREANKIINIVEGNYQINLNL